MTSQLLHISRAWERLEKAEHSRELALRKVLIRQEKLERKSGKTFDKTIAMYRKSLIFPYCMSIDRENFMILLTYERN